MTELSFDVLDMTADRYAVIPTINARLRVAETTGATVHSIALRTQIKIDANLRRYSPTEQEALIEQFGEPGRWGETLRGFTWTHESVILPGFSGSTETEIPIECTYDLEVIGSRFFHALEGGTVPLEFLFNGTVFMKGGSGMQVEQIPWHKAAPYEMPVSVWRDVIDRYFPNTGWLRLHRDTIRALQRYKGTRAIATWDDTLTQLLERAGERA